MNIFAKLEECFREIVEENDLTDEVIITGIKTLTPEESIGITERKDFPILTGKEKMIEADFRGSKGQAFTSAQVNYTGSISDIMEFNIEANQHDRGIFIAVLNGVMKHLGLIEKTVHCKNEKPDECGIKVSEWLVENFKDKKIALVGYQPSMFEAMSKEDLNFRVLDLNPDNVGDIRYGKIVEHGEDDYEEVIKSWADLVLCTGSSIINGSIVKYLNLDIPVYFYGNTIAGPAECLDLNRICYFAD